MNRSLTTAFVILSLLGSAESLGEDVEHSPIVLPPLPARIKTPTQPKPQAPPADEETDRGPRFASPFDGPRHIDLGPLGQIPIWGEKKSIEEHLLVSQRVNGFFQDAQARRRVQLGHVDPAWLDLARRMEHHWKPSFEDIRDPRIAEVSGEWFRDSIWQWLGGWYEETQRQRQDPFARPKRLPGDTAATAAASLLDLQRDCLGDGYGNKVVTLVEVRYDAKGLGQARMLSSSGHKAFDRQAMAGVQSALVHDLGQTPPPGPARSIYAMTAQYIILPPIPVVGFSFDLVPGGEVNFFYPLKKIVRGNAVLLALYREAPPETP